MTGGPELGEGIPDYLSAHRRRFRDREAEGALELPPDYTQRQFDWYRAGMVERNRRVRILIETGAARRTFEDAGARSRELGEDAAPENDKALAAELYGLQAKIALMLSEIQRTYRADYFHYLLREVVRLDASLSRYADCRGL